MNDAANDKSPPEKAAIEALIERLRGSAITLRDNMYDYDSESSVMEEAADALSRMAGEARIVVRWEDAGDPVPGQLYAFVGSIEVGRISETAYDHWNATLTIGKSEKYLGVFPDESTARAAVAHAAIEALTKGGEK
jgi:hypothetical protein